MLAGAAKRNKEFINFAENCITEHKISNKLFENLLNYVKLKLLEVNCEEK